MKYKLVVFVPLFVLIGCEHKHTCLVRNVHKNEIYAYDIESGKNKTFVYHGRYDHFEYIYPGDTFECISNNRFEYKYNTVIDIPYMGHLMTNIDSLNARQNRKWREKLKQAGYEKYNQIVR